MKIVDILREPYCPKATLLKPGRTTDAGYDLALADDALIPPLKDVPRALSRIANIETFAPTTLESIGYKDGALPKGSPFTIQDGGIWQMRYNPPLFRTGIHTLPRDVEGLWFMVALRSSAGTKVGLRLHNHIGVIDPEYQDEILLALYSAYDVPILLPKGERVAQLIPMDLSTLSLHMTTDRAILLDRGNRGGGYGSTNNEPLGRGLPPSNGDWGMSGGNVFASFET